MSEEIASRQQTSTRKRLGLIVAAVALAAVAAIAVLLKPSSTVTSLDEQWALLDRYCVDCHNSGELAGGVAFDRASPNAVTNQAELWEHVTRKLSGNLMPPPGSPRPTDASINAFVTALESRLDESDKARANPGYVTVHRLNRREYAAAVEAMLGIQIDPAEFLPSDLRSDGFDNVADVLRISPAFFDQYIAAARQISIRAIGDPNAPLDRNILIPSRIDPSAYVDGLPLGTRGGVLAAHHFPADGDYEFSIDVGSIPGDELRAYPDGWIEFRHKIILTIDGERVFEDELGGEEDSRAIDQRQIAAYYDIKDRFTNIRVPVKAGVHQVGATFVARTYAESDKLLQAIVPGAGERSIPRIRGVEVVGPYAPSGIAGSTVSRDSVFICRPSDAVDEQVCAEDILRNLAHQAFRQDVTDSDVETLLGFYRVGVAEGGFEAGIRRGLMAVLASPKFLFRSPQPPLQEVAPGEIYPINDVELASRLSFFLWGRGPDERLLALASAGTLNQAAVLTSEVERMLADERSKSLVTDFAFQWLALESINSVDPDPRLFPNFTDDLRADYLHEMEYFLDSILRNDRSVLDLFDANYTYVNENLARVYGISEVRGPRFRRVALQDSHRWGLFGKGAVLMQTSYPHRTSPVLRGTWIMDHILATPPSPPPPGVETDLEAVSVPEGLPPSLRLRLETHRADTSCNHCHGVIDPLGLALENFNAIGEWREFEREEGVPIDASGQLASGEPVSGPKELREAMLARPTQVMSALTEKLMAYALGRRLEYYDMPTVRSIVRDVAQEGGFRFSALVQQIVATNAFRYRRAPLETSLTIDESSEGASIAAR